MASESLFTLIAYSCGDFLDVVLLRWMYSFTLNISLGLMQLFGFCFATTNLWKEARGHPSSWDFCAWRVWRVLESELLHSVSLLLWSESQSGYESFLHRAGLQIAAQGVSPVYRCIFRSSLCWLWHESSHSRWTGKSHEWFKGWYQQWGRRETSMFLCMERSEIREKSTHKILLTYKIIIDTAFLKFFFILHLSKCDKSKV